MVSPMRGGLEELGDKFQQWVFPFEGLPRALWHCEFDYEQCAVRTAHPRGIYWVSQGFLFRMHKHQDCLARLDMLNP